MRRRQFFKTLGLLFVSSKIFALNSNISNTISISNFKYIYTNVKLRYRFHGFLKNVFTIFPTALFHKLIYDKTQTGITDKEIYNDIQSHLDSITPSFSALRYQLPSLTHQKEEMMKETVVLLGECTTYNGYLEIGPSGRYLDYLEEKVNINGNRYYADVKAPGYSFTEIMDRGQVIIGAEYIPLADYKTQYSKLITNNSLELVVVYIGFHHCPLDLRIPFISSIKNTLKKGGKLILRDHDCNTDEQKVLVALAHDVFNMGTLQPWEYNEKEIRNFYSLDFIIAFVEKTGFKFENKTLYQQGDPTKNALMMFTKI